MKFEHCVPFEISAFAKNNLIYCDAIGCEHSPNFHYNRKHFDNNLLMFVTAGTLVVKQYDQTVCIEKGSGILMDLKVQHEYYFKKNTPSEIIWFHFRGNPADHIMKNLSDIGKLPIIFSDASFVSKFERLHKLFAGLPFPNEFEASKIIYELIIDILENANAQTATNDFKTLAAQYIMMHLNIKISLEELAGTFYMSKYSFCRKFKQELEMTPFEYINFKRIEAAKKLLTSECLTVAQIAQQLGYYDQSYFTKMFIRYAGLTPTQYRMSHCFQ